MAAHTAVAAHTAGMQCDIVLQKPGKVDIFTTFIILRWTFLSVPFTFMHGCHCETFSHVTSTQTVSTKTSVWNKILTIFELSIISEMAKTAIYDKNKHDKTTDKQCSTGSRQKQNCMEHSIGICKQVTVLLHQTHIPI